MSCAWYLVLTLLLQVAGDTTADWPYGVYALLKPIAGCTTGWHDKGWIFQDTENTNPSNNRSETLHIDGHVSQSYVIRSFCIKKNAGSRRTTWPDGAYCTYKRKGDSTSSIDGWIEMEDEKTSNKDRLIFYSNLYQIDYDAGQHFLQLRFNCKISENKKKIPISLPITKPFYLLPYGSRDCQQVKWMVATSEWIKYHTGDAIQGTVPYKLKDNIGITMFYCYYESCNYTLNDTKGVLQSPGFPGKYPDGQLCSWRIMVPDNHTLHVHFTNFSLSGDVGNDFLQFSKRVKGGSFREKYTLNSKKKISSSFTHKFDSEVEYIFHSDQANASSGFRAEYTIFPSRGVNVPTVVTEAATKATKSSTSITATTTYTKAPAETPAKTLEITKGKINPQTTTATKTKITNMSTKKSKRPTSNHQFSTSTNGCTTITIKKSFLSENEWSRKLLTIVIPLACTSLLLLAVIGGYCCRSRLRSSRTTQTSRSADHLPLVVNPTYDRGAILLNHPNDTTTLTTILEVNENGTVMNQPVTDKPPEYEDVEGWKPNKATPNMITTTTEERSKTSENPFYESVLNSPPLVEGNKLYESIKIDKEKANKEKAK